MVGVRGYCAPYFTHLNVESAMFEKYEKRITQRLNTVDLNDDLDDVELIFTIEEEFQITISDAETEKILRVGHLYQLILSKIDKNQDFEPLWDLTCQIIRAYSGSKDPIDIDTTFLAKFAEPREGIEV